MMHRILIFTGRIVVVGIMLGSCVMGQDATRLNQIGFYPKGPKYAIAVESSSDIYYITSENLLDTLYSGSLGPAEYWSYSDETVKLINFSAFDQTGIFRITLEDLGPSYPFSISSNVHQHLLEDAIKGYYYQRASMALDVEFAGPWERPEGHADNAVLIHASAASANRPVNSTIDGSGGWYDAGDYNKYIVNSGISTYTILAAYEHYPTYFQKLNLNIPESTNLIPDILDEALWNLWWMLKMQDPGDGGVYHKLTHANFSGVVMPDQATAPRYVVQKSTPATLDFAAVMAQASRIFKEFEAELPGFSEMCLEAAIAAWNWARKYPDISYDQNQINNNFDPDINTGTYGDGYFVDEFQWAAAELYITTKADSFINAQDPLTGSFGVPWWGGVNTLGLYSLAFHRADVATIIDTSEVKLKLLILAEGLRNAINSSAYRIVIGESNGNFSWGSNGVAANQGMLLIQAYTISGDSTFLDAAIQNLDYMLGRNATGYCFVTGEGTRPPMNPHHRPSEADEVEDPVPGLLVGGPNPHQEDGCSGYIGDEPACSYLDSFCSYASNEICINWNAPLVYLAGAIEALYASSGEPTSLRNKDMGNTIYPQKTGLLKNFPNPFNPSTQISYWLSASGNVDLRIYNVSGQLVKTIQHANMVKGIHIVTWNAETDNGSKVTSGVYFARLVVTSAKYSALDTKKMIVLK